MQPNPNDPTSTPLSRRQALLAGIAATGACLAEFPAVAQDKKLIPIVDCHQHLWDLDKQKLPWLTGTGPLIRNFVMKDYLESIKGTGIAKAVYMEVDVANDEKIAEGELLTDICKKADSPTVAAVIGCIPDASGFGDYLRHWKGNKYIKGFRTVLFGDGERCLKPEFVKAIQQVGEAGFSFDLCMSPVGLANGVKLVEKCPGTRFIVDHCGNVEIKSWRSQNRNDETSRKHIADWQRDMTALAAKETTICKISGIIAQAPKEWSADDLAPAINFCLDTFGPDRVVVGSDWPVCLKGATLLEWTTALRQIISTRSEVQQRKLLYENAIGHYGLEKLAVG